MVVAQAGRKGAVTLATNMAGRGTDIVLGGNPEMMARVEAAAVDPEERQSFFAAALERHQLQCALEREQVLAAGGLYILGTERHESRRIDNQLRGRSGRQGDPGASRFYLSLEDDLLRIFGSQRVAFVMDKLRIPEGEPIEHGMISKAIENAQKKVEAHNYDIRKHLIDYDDVMNRQREVIYTQRREILGGTDIRETIESIQIEAIGDSIASFCPDKTRREDWDWRRLGDDMFNQFAFYPDLSAVDQGKIPLDELESLFKQQVQTRFEEKEAEFTPPVMAHLCQVLLLQTIDSQWKGHLLAVDHLKEGIGLRGYGQKDPKGEYKREAFDLFMQMMGRVRQEVLQKLFRVQLAREEEIDQMEARRRQQQQQILNRMAAAGDSEGKKPVTREEDKVGRNDSCPCGSGKKYKKCCGR
jgi:preprotein translocase subunit SecA